MGGGDNELCSDELSIGGYADDDAGSPGVYKVGVVVSSMMAPCVDVGVIGNPSND